MGKKNKKNSSENMKLEKIPIKELLNVLQELYDKGTLYIDLMGEHEPEQDVVTVFVREEYMKENITSQEEEEEDFPNKIPIVKPLSNKDIEDLL